MVVRGGAVGVNPAVAVDVSILFISIISADVLNNCSEIYSNI